MTDFDIVPRDIEIRPALRSAIIKNCDYDPDTVIIEELGLCRGQVRVDIAVVNGTLHGYEIKSDRDSLRRLGNQIEYYGRVLDTATLVVGDRHLTDALDLLPTWWGVLRVRPMADELQLEIFRRGRKNPGQDIRSLVELLWLADAIALLEERNCARGVRGKPRRIVWDRICECLSLEEIGTAVRAQLKSRAVH